MISQERLVQEEQKNLNKVISILDQAMLEEDRNLTKSMLEHQKSKDMCLPDTYGSLIKALNDEENAKRNLKRAKNIKDELYDTHLVLECRDINSSGNIERIENLDFKVGLHTYYRKGEIIVISWVRPTCRHYLLDNSSEEYESIVEDKYGEKHYTHYSLKLKRRIEIFFDRVKSVSHLYPMDAEEYEEIIADEFLQELLSRRSEEEFRNIVFSIQKRQGEIIQTPYRQNLIVQGCAGSGKSMIMLHRLPILLYDNPESLNKNNIYIITPSKAYIQMAQRMLIELEISDIQLGTIEDYYLHVLDKYGKDIIDTKDLRSNKRPQKVGAELEKYIYSEECASGISQYIKAYTNAGKVDLEEACAKFGINPQKSKPMRPINAIRDEAVLIQSILNANSERTRVYFQNMHALVDGLNTLERMLSTRKIAVVRAINKEISMEETVLAKTQKELKEINRLIHPIMYNNRLRTIRETSELLNQHNRIKIEAEKNDEYFNQLYAYAELIRELTMQFEVTRDDADRPSSELMYRAVELQHVFVEKSQELVEEINALEDLYNGYVEPIARMTAGIIPLIVSLDNVSESILPHDYFNKIEKRSKYLSLLGNNLAQDVYGRALNDQGIMKKPNGEFSIYKFTPYLMLLILNKIYGAPNKGVESLIAIDEAQNMSREEFELISAVNRNQVVLNLYGDVKQHVEGTKGLDSWTDIKDIADFDIQQMNENYRNARQITQYCNELFNLDMRAINLDGDGVHVIKDEESLKQRINTLFHSPLKPGISCILVKTEEEVEYLKQSTGMLAVRMNDITAAPADLMPNKWNVLTIDQAKGLEFETAIVLSGRMTENEKYIAYTRALNELYVYDGSVELPKEPEDNPKANNKVKPNKTAEKLSTGKEKSDKKEKPVNKKIIVVQNGVTTTKVLSKDKRLKKSKPESTTKQSANEKLAQPDTHTPTLKEYLDAAGLKTVDMRSKKGCLWVVGSKDQIGEVIEKAVDLYNVTGSYAKGKAIGYVDGWFTKSKK